MCCNHSRLKGGRKELVKKGRSEALLEKKVASGERCPASGYNISQKEGGGGAKR